MMPIDESNRITLKFRQPNQSLKESLMPLLIRYALAFITAVLSTSVLASFFSTQSVIASLQAVGADVSFGTRLTMTLNDLKILQALAPITSVCLLIGFSVATACNKYLINHRIAWFIVAGACAFISTLLLLNWFFQLMPIAGARSLLGLTFQGLAGAIGGYLFVKTTTHIHSSD